MLASSCYMIPRATFFRDFGSSTTCCRSILAGYADLWLALYFGLAVMALSEWQTGGGRSYLLISVIMALGCTQMKVPGLVFAGIVDLVVLFIGFSPGRMTCLCIAGAIAIISTYLMLWGAQFDLPFIGEIIINRTYIKLPYPGAVDLVFNPTYSAFLRALFIMINWHLLWYLLFLAAIFSVTHYYRDAQNFVTLNRTLLYVVIPII